MLNSATLEAALNLLAHGVYGKDPYPTLEEKAAYLMHRIVTGHVFRDGNKRTGLMIAQLTAQLNGRSFPIASTDQDAIEFTLSLADGQKSYEETLYCKETCRGHSKFILGSLPRLKSLLWGLRPSPLAQAFSVLATEQ
jgi:death-on-curing protein